MRSNSIVSQSPVNGQPQVPQQAPPTTKVAATKVSPPVESPQPAALDQSNGGGFFSSFLRTNQMAASQPGSGRKLPPPGAMGDVVAPGLKLAQVPEIVCAPEEPTDRERIETEIIKSLILSYFNIVKRNICDLVPKTVMHFTVNAAKDIMQKELVTQLYKEDIFKNLLKEPDDVSERRTHCKEMLEILRGAVEVISQLRDINMGTSNEKTVGSGSPVSLSGMKMPPMDSRQPWEGF
jgi:hypothetical protein